jgi:transcriptional regulator
MYVPPVFDEPRLDVMHDLMRARPLATLVTLASSGLNANHVPLLVFAEPAPFGLLRGHVARANPVWSDFSKDVEALAVFHGPNAYISPTWYPTKKETGNVVPTWNYVAVHAYGFLRVVDDPVWVRAQIEELTARNESAIASPWAVADAPPAFIDKMIRSIVGIEIVITKLSGKWKVSQNQPPQNQSGVVAGLGASDGDDASAIAALVRGNKIS